MGEAETLSDRQLSRWRLPDALPPMTGLFGTAMLILWFALFGAMVAGVTAAASEVSRSSSSNPATAYGIGFSPDGTLLPVGSAARAQRIRPGDAIVAIDGRAVTAPAMRRSLSEQTGASVSVETRSSEGQVSHHVLRRSPTHLREELERVGLSPTFVEGAFLGINYVGMALVSMCALVLFARRRHDSLSMLASLSLLLLAVGDGPVQRTLQSWGGRWYDIALDLNYLAFTVLIAVFALFPTGRFTPRFAVWGLITFTAVANWFAVDWDSRYGNFVLIAQMSVAVLIIRHRYRHMDPGPGRQQIRWAMLGFGASVFTLVALTAAQWIEGLTHDYAVMVATSLVASLAFLLTILFQQVGIAIALLRYRLYDADTAIGRSVSYGLLTVGLLAVFAGSEKVIEVLGEEYFGESLGALAGGLGAAVAAVMIAPMHHRITHWAEKRFRKGLLRLKNGLPLLVGDLRETAPPARIAAAVLDAVSDGMHATRIALVAGDVVAGARGIESEAVTQWYASWRQPAQPGFDCDKADMLFPVRIPLDAEGHGRVGWLLLGPRPDGSLYGKDERDALDVIADPAARALEIARLRETRDRQQESRLAAIEQSLADALRRLALPGPAHAAAVE